MYSRVQGYMKILCRLFLIFNLYFIIIILKPLVVTRQGFYNNNNCNYFLKAWSLNMQIFRIFKYQKKTSVRPEFSGPDSTSRKPFCQLCANHTYYVRFWLRQTTNVPKIVYNAKNNRNLKFRKMWVLKTCNENVTTNYQGIDTNLNKYRILKFWVI